MAIFHGYVSLPEGMSWEFSWDAIQWDALGMNDGDSTEFNTDFMEFWYI